MESTDNPKWDVEAVVQITDIDDENLDDDIKTEVLHMQGLSMNHAQLEIWHSTYNIEYHPGGLW